MDDDNLCTVEWNATAGNAAAAPGSLPESVALPLGATLAALSGLFLALSMVIQRYALAYPTYHVNVIITRLPRPAVWSVGFAVYFAANLLFAYSSTLTPLTLNATLFTLLLVWNLLFSWLCLHERIAPPRAIGAVLIVIGAAISVCGTPLNARNDFGPDDIADLVADPLGAAYMVLQISSGLVSAAAVVWFERTYALSGDEEEYRRARQRTLAFSIIADGRDSAAFAETPAAIQWRKSGMEVIGRLRMAAQADRLSKLSGGGGDERESRRESPFLNLVAAAQEQARVTRREQEEEAEQERQRQASVSALVSAVSEAAAQPPGVPAAAPSASPASLESPKSARFTDLPSLSIDEGSGSGVSSRKNKPRAPARLASIMVVVYPLSLGLLEGVTQNTVKALTAIAATCNGNGWPECCWVSGTFWSFLIVFGLTGILTVVWLQVVYTRFETTRGLPIEYGTVHICSILGGLTLYEEATFMDSGQMALTVVGLLFVLGGVIASARKDVPCVRRQQIVP